MGKGGGEWKLKVKEEKQAVLTSISRDLAAVGGNRQDRNEGRKNGKLKISKLTNTMQQKRED